MELFEKYKMVDNHLYAYIYQIRLYIEAAQIHFHILAPLSICILIPVTLSPQLNINTALKSRHLISL